MAHYLQKVRQVEILQMKTEFLKDQHNNIWLSIIKDIHYRPTRKLMVPICDQQAIKQE